MSGYPGSGGYPGSAVSIITYGKSKNNMSNFKVTRCFHYQKILHWIRVLLHISATYRAKYNRYTYVVQLHILKSKMLEICVFYSVGSVVFKKQWLGVNLFIPSIILASGWISWSTLWRLSRRSATWRLSRRSSPTTDGWIWGTSGRLSSARWHVSS